MALSPPALGLDISNGGVLRQSWIPPSCMYIRLIYAFPCQRLFISFTLARITQAATAFIRHCKSMPENSICYLAQRLRGQAVGFMSYAQDLK